MANDRNEKTLLGRSALRALSIGHILTSSIGGQKLYIESKGEQSSSAIPAPQNLPSSLNNDASSVTKRKASEDAPETPVPKRRGRPPKVRGPNDPPPRVYRKSKPGEPARPMGRPKAGSRAPSVQEGPVATSPGAVETPAQNQFATNTAPVNSVREKTAEPWKTFTPLIKDLDDSRISTRSRGVRKPAAPTASTRTRKQSKKDGTEEQSFVPASEPSAPNDLVVVEPTMEPSLEKSVESLGHVLHNGAPTNDPNSPPTVSPTSVPRHTPEQLGDNAELADSSIPQTKQGSHTNPTPIVTSQHSASMPNLHTTHTPAVIFNEATDIEQVPDSPNSEQTEEISVTEHRALIQNIMHVNDVEEESITVEIPSISTSETTRHQDSLRQKSLSTTQAPVHPDLEITTPALPKVAEAIETASQDAQNPTKISAPVIQDNPRRRSISKETSTEPPRAIPTSQDDLDREAGIARVYIDPKGSERDFGFKRGRHPKKSSIAVFKSDKLKDPEWLEKRRGTWIEVSAERLAGRLIEVEDEAQLSASQKRKRKRSGAGQGPTPKKAKKAQVSSGQDPIASSPVLDPMAKEIEDAILLPIAPMNPPEAQTDEINSQSSPQDTAASQGLLDPSPVQPLETPVEKELQLSSIVDRVQNQDDAECTSRERGLEGSVEFSVPGESTLHDTLLRSPTASQFFTAQPQATYKSPYKAAERDALDGSRHSNEQVRQTGGPVLHDSMGGEAAPRTLHHASSDMLRGSAMQGQTQEADHPAYESSIALSRTYISPFPPPNSYRSPYQTSNTALQNQQSQSSLPPTLPTASTQPGQGYNPSLGMYSVDPLLGRPSPSWNGKVNPSSFNAATNRPPVHPQRHTPGGSMSDFHQRYSSSYSSHQPQVSEHPYLHSLSNNQPPQSHRPAALMPQRQYLEQDQWTSMINSQLSSHNPASHMKPNPMQNQVPEIENPQIIEDVQPALNNIRSSKVALREAETGTNDSEAIPARDLTPAHPALAEVAAPKPSMTPAEVPGDGPQPKRTYNKKLGRSKKIVDKITPLLISAEAVVIPEETTRLACLFKDVAGNLLLSKDLAALNFYDAEQDLSENPMFALPVAKIVKNPITSAPGSLNMELRVKAHVDPVDDEANEESSEVTHSFTFAPSESSTEAANAMRAKIVTALIAYRFRAGQQYDRPSDLEVKLLKKYHCEKCDSRFKNINGLQYHQTKSNTTCNPNFDAATFVRKQTKPRKEKPVKPPKPEEAARPARPARKAATSKKAKDGDTEILEEMGTPNEDGSGENMAEYNSANPSPRASTPNVQRNNRESSPESDTSEDSIVQWALEHATTGLESVPKMVNDEPKPRDTSRLYKALNRETEILKGIVKDITDAAQPAVVESIEGVGEPAFLAVDGDASKQNGTLKENDASQRADTANDSDTLMRVDDPASQIAVQLLATFPEENMSDKLGEEILLSLVRANNDVFPGERSLWFAIVAIWLKMHPIPKSLPRSTLAAKAIDSVIYDKKVEKHTYTFTDKKKRVVTRSILHIPGADLKSSVVDMMKSLVRESVPAFYVPAQFAPPPKVLATLQALASRAIAKRVKVQEAVQENPDEAETLPSESPESESPIAPLADDAFDDDSDDDEFVDDNDHSFESESEAEDEMEDDLGESNDDVLGLKSPKVWVQGPHQRKRSAKHNAAIAAGVRRKWDEIRAGGDNPFHRGRVNSESRKTRGASTRLTEEEKAKRARAAELRQQSWNHAPAFMPNSETGAWDQGPPKKGKAPYSHKRLPEPITFLQDPSGAWSVRPFGHGVLPVFARPSRRKEGNPNFDKYMNNVLNGHRPIIYPKGVSGQAMKMSAMQISKQVSLDAPQASKPKRVYRKRGAARQSVEADDDENGIRISRATGKPVRVYRRKFYRQDSEPLEQDDEADKPNPFESLNPYSLARSRAQKARFMTEVEVLNFFEPKKLPPGAPLNIGLETLPLSFGLDPTYYKGLPQADLQYAEKLEITHRIPRSADTMQADPKYGCYTMDHQETPSSANYNLRWDEQTAFTLETLPYDQLNDEGIPSPPAEEDAPPPKRRRIQPQKKYCFSRLLTMDPGDFAGIFDDPYQAVDEFGIQMAGSIENGRKRRQKPIGAVMPPAVEAKFLVVCCVVRVLTGGLDQMVDWVIVQKIFPEMSEHFMKKQWGSLTKRKDSVIARLMADFQSAFLQAYQKGEVAPIDYDHLPDYDWAALINWAMKNVDTQMGNKPINIPSTKDAFEGTFHYAVLDRDDSGWRENFYAPGAPVYRRIESTAAEPKAISISRPLGVLSTEIDDMVVAKSWIRAVALTPERDYSTDVATARLNELGKKLAEQAFSVLMQDKIIVHRNRKRATIGRAYEASENFYRPLTKNLKSKQFVQAATYKTWLDEQFLNGVESVRADYFADDGAIMCITSLQAHGRIRLEPIGVPMDKFGLTEGGYETRQIPREKLRFEMDIYPTSTYLYDESNIMLNQALTTPCPVGSEQGEIPVWFGITDIKITGIWNALLMSVGSILAFRSGMDMAGLKKIYKSTMADWEFKLFMAWGEEQGFFVRIGDKVEAWTVGEWWWLVVGKSFAAKQRPLRADGTEDTEMADV